METISLSFKTLKMFTGGFVYCSGRSPYLYYLRKVFFKPHTRFSSGTFAKCILLNTLKEEHIENILKVTIFHIWALMKSLKRWKLAAEQFGPIWFDIWTNMKIATNFAKLLHIFDWRNFIGKYLKIYISISFVKKDGYWQKLKVNGHGITNDYCLAESVVNFTLVRSDGKVIECSRESSDSEGRELFGLCIGGYGLFGIIYEITLKVNDNFRVTMDSMMIS